MEIFDPQINDYRSVWGIYDGISRQIQSQVDAGGSLLISSTSFTAANQTFRQSNPISVSGTGGTYVDPGWAANTYTEYEYDALGRTTKVTAPGNIITATQYSGLVSTQTDPNGNKVKQTNDGLGRLSKVQDLTSGGSVYGTMIYAYDILGQLTKTTDAQNNQTKLTYDNLGRKIRMVDPDMGTWAYTYDSLGNLTQQTDANGKVLSFGYDSLHRLIQKAEQNSGTQTVLASYQYGTSAGNIGRRTQMTDGSGSTTWSYSNFGRDVSEQKTIGNVSNTSYTQSDWLGRNTSVTYPDGEVLTYQYDSLGRVQNVKSSSDPATTLADLAYNSLSQITGMNLKNGIHIANTYNDGSNQRLANRNAVVNSTTLIDFSYTYDAAGNITQLNDNKLHQVNTYTYDSLNRLKSAESSNNTDYQYRQKYDYDKVGNILQVSDWEKDIILKSDFEDATLADWSATVKDNNNLFTNDASAFAPALGAASLAVVVDDNNPVYVQDNSPANNTQYRARFFVNRNTLNMAVNDQFTLFQAKNASGGLVFGIDVNKSAAGYNLVLYSNTDANPASKPSTTVGLNDGWICLEVNWVAASGAGQNNGLVTLWRNGSMDASLTGLDNDTLSVDSVRLGAVEGVDTGTRGQFNLDAFESRRYTYIGSLLPQIAGAVDDVVPVSYKNSIDNGIKVIGDVYYAQEPQDTPTETETPVPPATETPVPPTLPADSATPTSTDTEAVSDTPVPTQTNTVENSATFTSTFTATSSPTITNSPTVTATATITPTPTITLTPTITPTLMLGEFVDGTGTDGDLNIAAGASFNLNTDASNGRSCPDGIAYNVSSLAGTLANLTEAPAAGCLGINDEVLLINLQGSTAYSENTGNYEFLRVKSISGASITFSSLKKHWYGDGMRSDSGIGTSAGNQKVMLMRVPNYNNVTVNGTLTASNWYGFNHGVITLRVKGTLAGTGSVNASTIGYRGYHPCGESYVETGTCGYGGGGKGETRQNTGTHASGGSGAYANNGNPGDGSGAYAGLRYGDSALEKIYMGSAGGEGGVLHTYNKGDIDGGGGGYGGGIIFIGANVINFTSGGGNLASNGQNSDSGGADGAGGSILVEAKVISRMDISAIGGWSGNQGSEGRVVVHYVTSQANISSNPAANISVLGAKPTPTVTPTVFTTPQWGNFGNGNDGELIVGASETFNIKANTKSTTRACADGGDAVEYIVAGLSETSATLFNSPSNGCIKAGDEVMLINLQGVDAGYSNTGNYEFLRVGSVDANVVSFTTPKVNFYGQNSTDDSAIGMDAASQRVMMIRVPNYSHVSNSGTLTTNGWSPNQNSGIIVFRVSGTLEGNGTIYGSDHGFWGGGGGWGSGGSGNGGNGISYVHDGGRYGGGQGGGHSSGSGGSGGGGGYKNYGIGNGGGRDGAGGGAYGDEKLNKMFLGSGGGGGGQTDKKKHNVAGDSGGTGGGIIFIAANTFQYPGSILNTGGGVNGNCGSASGGSVRLEGNVINIGGINNGSVTYQGSAGRTAIYYRTSFSGSAPNAYLKNINTDANDSLFSDDFETGDLSRWSAAYTDSGDLSASMAANYWGDYGMNAVLDDNNAVYVVDNSPTAEKSFHARFYINGDGVSISSGGLIYVLQGIDNTGTIEYFHVLLQKSGTTSQVIASIRASNGTYTSGPWVNLNSGWNSVEIGWEAKELFGTLSLWVNGTQVTSLTNIDNQADSLEYVRLGMIGSSGTISGQLAIDDYESRRYSYIGMMPDRGVPDPEATQEPGWAEKVYTYSNSHAHAVETVSLPSGQNTYQYDANGNMTQRVENGVTWTQTYNSENRLATMSNGTTTWLFSYDGDGTRVGQLVTNGTGAIATSYFAGGAYEVTVNGSTQTVRKYYSLAGSTFAMSDNGVMKYLLSDHLGSTVAVTDAAGTLLEESRYMPFGEVRNDVSGVTSTDKTYTGQKSIPDTGLMDYKARMYDPLLGRFIQPDTIVPGAGNPQAWNRYSYVINNPIKFVDNNGHMVSCRDGGDTGACGDYTPDYVYWLYYQNHHQPKSNQILIQQGDPNIKPIPVPGNQTTTTPINKTISEKGIRSDIATNRRGTPTPNFNNVITPTYQPVPSKGKPQNALIGYDINRIAWGDIELDLLGIIGDVLPPAQPGVEGLEAIKAYKDLNMLIGLVKGTRDTLYFTTFGGVPFKSDLPTTIFDFGSLVPIYGSIADLFGLANDIIQGFYIY
jgi:RHS repeat-associated protein